MKSIATTLFLSFLLSSVLLILTSTLFAKNVALVQAKKVALNMYSENSGIQKNSIEIKEIIPVKSNGVEVFRIFNFNPQRYIVITADDNAEPLIGYGINSNFDFDSAPPALIFLLEEYKKEMKYIIEKKSVADEKRVKESPSKEKSFDQTTEWEMEIYSETQLLKEKISNSRNSIVIIPQFHVFINNDEYRNGSFSPVNPGIEIVYERKLNTIFSVSSGLSYIYSSWNHSIGIKSHFKRISQELFIPVLVKSRLKKKIYLSYGIYSGWLITGKELYRNNIDIRNWRDNTHTTHYNSSPKYTMDLFIGAGIKPINEKHSFGFIPFIKYKMKDNWMGEVRNRLTFGIKINYSI